MKYKRIFFATFLFITISCCGIKSQVVDKPTSFELFIGGAEGNDIKTGIVTKNNSDIKLSIGGGRNLGIRLGYRFDNNIEIFGSLYNQKSFLIPTISNGSGSFSKLIFHPMISYKLHIYKPNYINIGAGIRCSLKNIIDVDLSPPANPVHNKFYYKTSIGPSVFIVYEIYASHWFSFVVTPTLYYQFYKLQRYNRDGVDQDINSLPLDELDAVDNLKGGGLEITFGFRFHI